LEPLESRELLTASSVASGVGTNIEYTGPYSNYMPVGSGPSSYSGYSSFGNIDVPASAFGLGSGASQVNSLSLNLYNTATSGTFAPTAGSFAVYFVPNDTTPTSSMRFGGPTGTQAGTQTGLAAIGTTTGGASTLGVDSTDLVGTFSVTSALPLGYTNFSFSSLGAGAQSGIANDLNNGTNVRLIVVSLDNTGKADWEGNFSTGYPQVQLDVNEAPLVNFTASSYTVNETDQVVGDHTIATIAVHRSGNPTGSLDVNYATSNGTAHQPTDYTATTGTLHWDSGDTADKTFTISFNNITTSDASRAINVTLSDHGGNPIAPVFPAAGNTATVAINYLQAGSVAIDQSSYAVNESAGTVAIKIDRTGSNVGTTTADVTLSTASGLPYQSDPQNPQDAQAGRDFGTQGNTVAPTYAVHFAVGQTSAIVNVPLINVTTFAGTRSFTATLSGPSTGTQIINPSATTVTITDNQVANAITPNPNGLTTYSSGVEVNGPFYVNSFINLVSASQGSLFYSSMPVITFGSGSAVFPTSSTVSTVDSVKLSIYNSATTGGYAGIPGSFDVYLLTDNSIDDSALVYGGGAGNTGPTVIGTQASPVYVGTANFTNNQVGYNDFTFDNLSASVKAALTADLNSGGNSEIRFAITPSQGSPVTADWQGNYFFDQPQLTVLAETGAAVVAPQVANVLVDGTAWTPTYLASLQAGSLGTGGYSIPVGSSSQLKDLYWNNLNQIQVVFSQNVNVQQASLLLTGVKNYAFSNFTYNPTTFTATWTLATTITADKLHIDLQSTGAAAVTSATGSTPLDGEWTNGVSSYPSGNGTSGGDFNFSFNVLPADVNQDGVVNGLDINSIASHWLQHSILGDVNGDNVVNGLDINSIASSWLATLPAGGGSGSGSASSLVAASAIAGPASVAGPTTEHTASFVGGPTTAPTAATVDSVMAQKFGDGTADKVLRPRWFDGKSLNGQSTSSSFELPSATVDDELLSTLASGGR
jgi:hypothetical protein